MCNPDRPEFPLLVNIGQNIDTLGSFLSVSCISKPWLLLIGELILALDIQRSFALKFIFLPFIETGAGNADRDPKTMRPITGHHPLSPFHFCGH